jgi:putative endonuclease
MNCSDVRQARGRAGREAGRRSEVLAALWLMTRGYRILGFRLKTRQAEIDLLALRGKVLAVVEIKPRTSLLAALETVTLEQRQRLRRAGLALAAGRPAGARRCDGSPRSHGPRAGQTPKAYSRRREGRLRGRAG